ncbi:hypothetical protein PsorP6_016257 [Peronosclerospora sorghi]|uniref:Uncharacterized protein n=1 Tax=Peronosclerospora sorghi TaxID=230839 RepID=A0ACC0VJC1_9STRA|nr:hypothetical protein PsorP6_016257 [Peronosclerospora sorghi]
MEPSGGNSEAICLAQASDWKSLQRLLERDPAMAKERGDHAMLPIHWACTVRHVPLSLIVKLVQAYPDGVRAKNSGQLLPLHIAIRAGVQAACLRKLVRAYPEAVTERTPDGVSALEMAQDLGVDTERLKVLYRAYERGRASEQREVDGQCEKEGAGGEVARGGSGQEEGEASGVERPGDDDDGDDVEAQDGKQEKKEGASKKDEAIPEPYVGNVGRNGFLPPSEDGELEDAMEWSTLEPEDSISMLSEQSLSDMDGLDMPHGHLVSPSSTSTCSQDEPRSPRSSHSSFPASYSTPTYWQAPAQRLATTKPHLVQARHVGGTTTLKAGGGGADDHVSHHRSMSQRGRPSHEHLRSFPSYDDSDDDEDGVLEEDHRSSRHSTSPRAGATRAQMKPREGLAYSAWHVPRRSVTLDSSQRDSPRLVTTLLRRASHELHGPSHEAAPEWKHDGECSICRATFGMFKHRHHCRNCGKSICSQHSADKKIAMEDKGFTTPQRVCVTCYAMITHSRSRQHGLELPEGQGGASALQQPSHALPDSTHRYDAALASVPAATSASNQNMGGVRSRSASDVSLSFSPPKRPSRNSTLLAAGEATGGAGDRVVSLSTRGSGSSATTSSSALQELRHLLASQQKQIEQLAQSNMQMQQQLLEQEEVKAETMLLITQLMTRVSVLELQKEQSHCKCRPCAVTGDSDDDEYPQDDRRSVER